MTHGFKELRVTPVGELEARLHEMQHEYTGLRLIWVEREDENKTFNITFPTIPWDDTGVFHILEHSVLCGSEHYPVKAPFMELLKNSMNTFLNAMTFPDKTMYPVSSRNDKDFINLIRVYLDAVFHPLIYKHPEIFMQEGWHYEPVQAEAGERGSVCEGGTAEKGVAAGVITTGVVLNEMRGDFADEDAKLSMQIGRSLYPDNAYRFVSGGHPDHITELKYEDFIAAHRRFYNPSNAYVILDGSLQLDEVLALLDSVLKELKPTGPVTIPEYQAPVDGGRVDVPFELADGEDGDKRYTSTWSYVAARWDERERLTAINILAEVLSGSNQAPLCHCILKDGLAESVSVSADNEAMQPSVTIRVRNHRKEDGPEIEKRIFETLRQLAKEGLDRKQIHSVMTNTEFGMRERDFGGYPQGLIISFYILDNWFYGGAPEASLEIGDLFVHLREKMDQGYFEQLIRECFLENEHKCMVRLVPVRVAFEVQDTKVQVLCEKELTPAKAEPEVSKAEVTLTGEELAKIRAEYEAFAAWQNRPELQENLDLLPRLALEDISAIPEDIPTRIVQGEGMTLLLHDVNSNDIAYVDLYFPADGLNHEALSALSFASSILGEMATEKYSASALMSEKQLLCGDLGLGVRTFENEETGTYHTYLQLGFSAMGSQLEAAMRLALEILTATRLEETEDAMDLLCQKHMELFRSIIISGAQYAVLKATAMLTPSGAEEEYTCGLAYYNWLKAREENITAGRENYADLAAEMKALIGKITKREGLTMGITGDTEKYKEIVLKVLREILPEGEKKAEKAKKAAAEAERLGSADSLRMAQAHGSASEAIIIPSDVAFAVRACMLDPEDMKLLGRTMVASKICELDYLWQAIRVQGGAYGAGIIVQPNGFAACYSYRDPDPKETLGKFGACGRYLQDFADTDPDLTGYIIGTVSDQSPLLTPRMKGEIGDQLYFRGVSYEKRCQRRKELLKVKAADIKAYGQVLEKAFEKSYSCVIGGRQQVEDCGAEHILTL